MTRIRWFLVQGLCLCSLVTASQAVEINARQHLAPETQLKVNRALAKTYSAGTQQTSVPTSSTGCGTTQVGAVPTVRGGGRVDNVTVVRGDVIVVNRNAKCR